MFQIFLGLLLISCMIFNSEGEPILSQKTKKVKDNEFPFIVSIQYGVGKGGIYEKHGCGGALISDRHVLTAAHCIPSDKFMESIVILVGSPHLHKAMKRYKPDTWLRYENWVGKENDGKSDKIYHDIAVIKLKMEGQAINPTIALLPTEERREGTDVTLAGWGCSQRGLKPSTMHKASLKVSSKSVCAAMVHTLQPCNSLDFSCGSIICLTQNPYVLGSCGDSGSPFLDENMYVIGIYSGVCPKLERTNPLQVNVAISVYHHRKFIKYALMNL